MEEYERRKGCSNLGGTYEYLMTALFSLRCALSENVQEFWIASNASSVGDCDDIVLSIKPTKGAKTAFLIQLKHVETKNKLKPEHLTYSRESKKEKTDENQKENTEKKQKQNTDENQKGNTDEEKELKSNKKKENFSIEKYWQGFQKLQENLVNFEHKSDIIKELGEVHNTILILYTNREVENCNFLKQVDWSDNFFDLLRTNDIKHCHGFDHNELPSPMLDWEKFLQNFYLFANQIHAEDVINVMEIEIQRHFNLSAPLMINFQDVVKEYIEYVKTWIKGYKIDAGKKFYTITQPDVVKTLAGILLKNYKYDFSAEKFTSYDDTTKMIWNKIISDKDVTLLNNSDSIVQFVQSYYGSKVIEFIQKYPTVWNTMLPKKGNKKFYKTFGHARVAQVCLNAKLSIMEIYKTVWMNGLIPLLLHLDDPKHFQDILKILEVCSNSIKVIVLVPDSANVDVKMDKMKYFVTFQDLHSHQQKELLEVEVSFQGRTFVPLSKLVDVTMYSIIKGHDVINILSKEFIVGSKFEERSEYFINRSVSRVLVQCEVLELQNETFIIETENIEDSRSKLTAYIKSPSLVHFVKLGERSSKQKFVRETVHRLLHNEGNLEWKESSGNIANLRSYVIPLNEHKSYTLVQPENLGELIADSSINRTKILSAGPGMGKSLMMDFIGHFAPENLWVIKINLTHKLLTQETRAKERYLRKMNVDPTHEDEDFSANSFDALKYFERLLIEDEHIYACKISLAVLRKFCKNNKILILLDGFDEISIDYKKRVTAIVQTFQRKQHAVWVTTRDHMKTHLEDSLNVLASTLKPFTRVEQKTFLINYFNGKIEVPDQSIVKKFADRLLRAADENLSARDGEFTGTPLQTKLLAKVFCAKCKWCCKHNVVKFNKRFDLLKLYDKFIEHKNKITFKKFGHSDKTRSKSEILVSAQKYFALRQVFGISALRGLDIEVKLAPYYEAIERQLIQRGGVMVVRESKNGIQIEFIHQTFAEYLAAKYLSEKLLSSNELTRTIVLFLIRERVSIPGYYQFLFMVFDRLVAKNDHLHLSIINIKEDYFNLKVEENPNVLLDCDVLKRNGLHMLALYGNEYPEGSLDIVLKKIEAFTSSQLSVVDLLKQSALDYCFRVQNWTVADSLCKAQPFLPLMVYNQDIGDITSKFVLRTIFHNFCIANLLIGEISEDDIIDQCWDNLSEETNLLVGKFKFLFKLNVATLREYLELVGIKETKVNKYYDIRFAVALGTIDNVKTLLDSTGVDINEQDCHNNATLVHYAIYNHRYDILEELIHRGGDLEVSDDNDNTAVHLLALNGAFGVLTKLCGNIAKYNVQNDSGDTPLDVAIKVNQFQAKKYFFNNYALISESQKVYYAALLGDNEILLQSLAKGCNINHLSDNYKTALHAALEYNHIDTAHILINHNIDLSTPSKSYGILHLVAKTGNRQLFEKLLSKGLNIDEQNGFGDTPLMVAIEHEHSELAEFIISRNANVSVKSTTKNALTQAIITLDEEELISLILEKGCDINEVIDGKTPLNLALQCKKPNIARLLLQRNPGPDISIADNLGDTPLHYAAEFGYADLVIDFLEKGINVDVQNKRNQTPLLVALGPQNIEVAEILMDHNANVLLEDNNKNTPLHYAVGIEKINLLFRILENGGDVNKLNNENVTPFIYAVTNSNCKTVNLLLQYGGDLRIGSFLGNSSLHLAARTGNNEIVQECLIKLKMNVNLPNELQDSPLFIAVAEDMVETARLLIDNGADVFQKGYKNNTILHYIHCISKTEFTVEILEMGVDVNAVNDSGETPLSITISHENLHLAELLLSRGANLDAICNDGQSILHLAAYSNFASLLLECLHKNIFDINLEDNQGLSSLECALEGQSLECVSLLLERNAHVKSHCVYVLFTSYLKDIQSEEELTYLLAMAKVLVERCKNLNELDKNQNTLLINIFTKGLSSSLNNFDLMWFCKVSNLLIDSGADKEIKGNRYRSANEIFRDAFEDANGMNDEQREMCLEMGLVSRLNDAM